MTRVSLLEREALLSELERYAQAAFRAGSGAALFVGGEAGAGKSALVREFTASRVAGADVLYGACDAMSAPRPLGPVADFAGMLGEEFRSLVRSGEQRQQIFERLLDDLRASRNGRVIVLEDLHWSDDATLDLLRFVARRIAACRAVLLCTYRDDEIGALHPLRRVLGELAGLQHVRRLSVPPLSLGAVERLVGDLPLNAAELHRRTSGNAFFVTEVLAAGGAALPSKVEDAVLARVARLSEPAREALESAAVIGLNQDLGLVEELAPSGEAVEECLLSGLLIGHDGALSFRHALAQEAVLGAMSALRRRHVHAAVLRALEAKALPESVAVLSHHAAGAGDASRILRYAPAAGRMAFRLGAYREARTQFARALPHAAALGPKARAELLVEHARASTLTGHDHDAMESHRLALEILREEGEATEVVLAQVRYAGALYNLGHKSEGERLVAEAVETVTARPEGPERAAVYYTHAELRMLDRDTPGALHWGRKAVASGLRTGNLRAVASAYNTLVGVLTTAERLPEARRYHQACLELVASHPALFDPTARVNAKVMFGSGLGEVYRFAEAEAALNEACELSSRTDNDSSHYYALAWLGLTYLYVGRWAEAGEAATRLLGRPNSSLITRIMAGVALGRLRVRRGDPEAWPVLDAALEEALRTDTLQRLAPVRAARAEAALAAGDAELAAAEAAAALPLAVQQRHRWFTGELTYLMRCAGSEVELPDWVTGPFAQQVRGQHDSAARAWRRLRCPFEEARALSESAEIPHLERAHRLFQELGATPAAFRVAQRMRQLGARGVPRGPRQATRANPAGLTAREQEVLTLLAQGLRNAQIAARHGVSERTVGHQVSAVLGKLGASTRTEAVAEAQRRGLILGADQRGERSLT